MKNILVVGGSSSIGKALVAILENENHHIFATFNTHHPSGSNQNTAYHHLDVLQAEYDLSFLPEKIDGFVYCPGSINLAPFGRIKPEDFAKDFELQVNGAIRILQNIYQ